MTKVSARLVVAHEMTASAALQGNVEYRSRFGRIVRKTSGRLAEGSVLQAPLNQVHGEYHHSPFGYPSIPTKGGSGQKLPEVRVVEVASQETDWTVAETVVQRSGKSG